ncbi:MAG: glutamine synthetase family protein [Acidimicrobiales bacterium]|nr:glutamine synthetase family protein [Acidimicrobiales bacterium]
MDLAELRVRVAERSIETVVVGFTDHYGRTMGKRFDADFFLDSCAVDGTHGCDYLLTVDMEMEPVGGYAYANWEKGYGDFHLVPDLATLREAAWTTGTALVLCDVFDNANHEPVAVAPRSILKAQLDALTATGLSAAAASELEFFLFRDSYRDAHAKGYRDLEAAGWYVEDYHLLQASRVEDYVGAARRALRDSDVPVENSKGEAAVGQHELNIRYADALTMADRHVVMKQAMKELADSMGVSVTFMAKPDAAQPGNSCHIHLSLWDGDRNAFAAENGRSDVFRWFLGGWMHHAADLMPFVAGTINSYKRYQDQSWAPTKIAWSTDNRTAGFRVVGTGPSLRIENRIPGGDTNPYLAYAAAIASGLDGIRNQIEPPAEFSGDIYAAAELKMVPSTLRDAVDRFEVSSAARGFFGDLVVDHYTHHLRTEIAAADAAVTDWEMQRYFERI